MKIMITGGSGLLGQYLNIVLSKNNDILTIYNEHAGNCQSFNSVKSDITNIEQTNKIFESFQPDIIVHTAAISRPELCDALPEKIVNDVNIHSTLNLAQLCEMNGAKLIFTSTDLIYDGDSGGMMKETDTPNPISKYAETKVESEKGIKKIFDNYIILRTSLLYGLGLNGSMNNFHAMYNNFIAGKPSKLFYDQYRTPLSLFDAARIISMLCRLDIKDATLNFGGAERVSRVELGEMLCDIAGFDRSLIDPVSMQDVPALHKVADVSMDTSLLKSLGINQSTIGDSIAEIILNA